MDHTVTLGDCIWLNEGGGSWVKFGACETDCQCIGDMPSGGSLGDVEQCPCDCDDGGGGSSTPGSTSLTPAPNVDSVAPPDFLLRGHFVYRLVRNDGQVVVKKLEIEGGENVPLPADYVGPGSTKTITIDGNRSFVVSEEEYDRLERYIDQMKSDFASSTAAERFVRFGGESSGGDGPGDGVQGGPSGTSP